MKKLLAIIIVLCMVIGLAACGTPAANNNTAPANTGNTENAANTENNANTAEPKIIKLGESFMYPSLDPHKDYYGWYTSIYGVSETLYRIEDDMSIVPMLAEGHTVSNEGKTWTIKISSKAAFSNGNKVTAGMVERNLKRLADVNERFAYLKDFTIKAKDDATLEITTPDVYPTMLCDLADSAFGIVDLDATTDFDKAPICTGPFVISAFNAEKSVEVVKNDKYWNGEVKLDGAVFEYLADDDSKLMAMQNGQIDGYTSVTAAAKAIYEKDPSKYVLTEIPATRLQFYAINKNRNNDAVRKAINLIVDNEAIASYLGGTVSAAVGPFSASAPYVKVTKPAPDVAKAKQVLEEDGYKLNSDGFYEKDGKKLELEICYYAARSLDSIALEMQNQFRAAGIASKLTVKEDPDTTYLATGDFDIALYCMIADKAGDP